MHVISQQDKGVELKSRKMEITAKINLKMMPR